MNEIQRYLASNGAGIYWEKARHIVDLKTLFPLKLNLQITTDGTKDPTWIWSKHFNKICFFRNIFLWQSQAFLQ